MNKIEWILVNVGSYIIAIIRLMFWEILLLFSGLQQIFFMRTEICGLELRGLPLRCDRDDIVDKIAYIDKLKCGNPDLELVNEDELHNLDDTDDLSDEGDEGEQE